MWKPSKNSGLPHRRASALAAALAVALPATAPAVTSGVDYVLRPFPGAAPEQQQERRLRVLDVQPGRVVPEFEFLYDAPAKWPGALHWRYNGGNVPSSLGGNKDAAIQHIVDASAKWTAACGVQIVYDGETTHAPNALIDGRADKVDRRRLADTRSRQHGRDLRMVRYGGLRRSHAGRFRHRAEPGRRDVTAATGPHRHARMGTRDRAGTFERRQRADVRAPANRLRCHHRPDAGRRARLPLPVRSAGRPAGRYPFARSRKRSISVRCPSERGRTRSRSS